MPTIEQLRAEMARLRIQQKEVAAAISSDKYTMSMVLNGKRSRPDLVEKAWKFVKKKKERARKG